MSEAPELAKPGNPGQLTRNGGRRDGDSNYSCAGRKDRRSGAAERRAQTAAPYDDKFKIFSGTANARWPRDLRVLGHARSGRRISTTFSDGETYVQILENVRGADVFVVQPTCYPVDQHLVELLMMIDALKRASARRITVVIPYFGYARQDRKDRPRVPISSKLVADLLTTAARTARCLSICTRRRSRASSISRWITCSRRRCWWATSGS